MKNIRNIMYHLAGGELWLAALLVAVSIAEPDYLAWAVIGMGLTSVIRWIGMGRWSLRTPVDWPVALLVGMALVSLWITPLPEKTTPQVYRLFTGILLFYTLVNWTTSQARSWIVVSGVILTGLSLAGVSFFSVQWPAGKIPLIPASLYTHFTNLVRDAIHPNVLAGNLVLFLPINFALLLYPWGKSRQKLFAQLLFRFLLACALIISLGVLFLTQSRGSWLAFGLAACLILALRFRWGWLVVFLAGGAGSWAGYTSLDGQILLRSLRSSFLVGEIAGRLELWARAIFMIADFSFTGVGMGLYQETANALYPLPGAAPYHAHNLFLQVGVDLGVPGLLAWLAIWMLVTLAAWRLTRRPLPADQLWLRGFGVGILGCQAAMAVHGLWDAVLWGMIRPAPLVWGIWGSCMGIYLLKRKTARGVRS